MRLKHTFPVSSDITLDDYWEIHTNGLRFELSVNNHNKIDSIVVSYRIAEEFTPKLSRTPEKHHRLEINIPQAPEEMFITKQLTVIQGLLSAYGTITINLQESEKEWMPENEAEKKALNLYKFKKNAQRKELGLPLAFNLLARAIIASSDLLSFEIPLAFFRHATQETKQHRYRTAFYNYFFFIESLYSNGKHKTKALLEEFMKSSALIDAVMNTREDVIRTTTGPDIFLKLLKDCTDPKRILKEIIELRGESHHHSTKNSRAWHPDDHDRFDVVTKYLHLICLKIILDQKDANIFSERYIETYKQTSVIAGAFKDVEIRAKIIDNNHAKKTIIVRQKLPTRTFGSSTMYTLASNFMDSFSTIFPGSTLVDFSITGEGQERFKLADYIRIENIYNSIPH